MPGAMKLPESARGSYPSLYKEIGQEIPEATTNLGHDAFLNQTMKPFHNLNFYVSGRNSLLN